MAGIVTNRGRKNLPAKKEGYDKHILTQEDILKPDQIKVLELYTQCYSWRKIEEITGIQHTTIYNWRSQEGAFKNAMKAISEEAVEQAKLSMKASIPKLVDRMIELADEGNLSAIVDTLNRVLGDPKNAGQNPGGYNQQQNNVVIKVNLAAHRESEGM